MVSIPVNNIDTTAPKIVKATNDEKILIKKDENGIERTSASQVTVTLSDTNGSGIDTSRSTYSLNGGVPVRITSEVSTYQTAGTYEFTVYDKAGNVTRDTLIIVDAPKINTLPSNIIDGAVLNESVTVYTTDGSTLRVNGQEVENNVTTIETKENSTDPYSITATDIYGNVSTLTFTIDTSIPVAPAISVSTENPTNKPITVTISYPDDAVYGTTEYKVGETGEVKVYEEPFEVSENDTIYAWYTTQTGDIEKVSATATFAVSNFDNVDPEMTFSSNEDKMLIKAFDANDNVIADDDTATTPAYYKTSASGVVVRTSDSGLGIKSVRYKLNGSSTLISAGKDENTITNPGTYEFIATDEAGNSVTKTIIIAEKPSMKTSPTIINGTTTSKNVTVTVTPNPSEEKNYVTFTINGENATSPQGRPHLQTQ